MNNSVLTIPHDFEGEQAVLGAIIYDNSLIPMVANILTPNCFHEENHRQIFRSMIELFNRKSPVDEILLGDELKSIGKLEDVGSYAYLSELVDCVPSSGNIEYYAKIIKEHAQLRELIKITSDIGRKSRDPKFSVTELLIEAETKIREIALNNNICEYQHIKDVVLEDLNRLEKVSTNKDEVIGLRTGITDLDLMTSGFEPGQLIIIGARPGIGKSALALNISEYAALDKRIKGAVYIGSLEMPNANLARRMLASNARVDSRRLKTGNLEQEDWDKLGKSADRLSSCQIYMSDFTYNIDKICYSVTNLHRSVGLKIFILDYLQLGEIEGKNNKIREQVIAEMSRKLKKLAKELGIVVIALSQLNRGLESRPNKRPQLSDLRESGCLSADTEIFIQNLAQFVKISEIDNTKKILLDSYKKNKNILTKGSKMFKTGAKRFFEIELITGQKIKATANHKFLIPGRIWDKVENFEVGSMVGVPLNFKHGDIQTISNDELKILALFIGNGCCLKRRVLQLTMHSEDVDLCLESIDVSLRLCNNELRPFYKKQIYRSGTTKESSAVNVFYPSKRIPSRNYRNPLVLFFEKFGLYNKRSNEKTIPGEIFLQPEEQKKMFIKYLWATDGTVCYSEGVKNRVLLAYSSSSYKLIKNLQILLQSVGILSSFLRVIKGKSATYSLRISSRYFVEKFLKEIGIAGKRKTSTVSLCLEKINFINPGWTKYELSDDKNIVYIPIKSITDVGEMEAYDIEVPKTHNFFANGIITHNSIEQDADIIIFLYRDKVYNEQSKYGDIAELILSKQREGPTGTIPVQWLPKFTKFTNLDPVDKHRFFALLGGEK